MRFQFLKPRHALAAAAAASTLVAAAVLSVSSAQADSGVKVMPLGDSITDGVGLPSGGGYRIDLWNKLVASGRTVDFVGSQTNGPSSLGDRNHEGHPGWTIAQIDSNITNWLRSYTPRTILLHIGTNDMYQGDPGGAPRRLSTLIDHITTQAPNADLFVATIIPWLPMSGGDPTVRAFNATIPPMVQSKVNAGKKVHLVDMYRALTAADLGSDGVHPNAGGYSKMATVWYNALLSVPGSIGDGGTTTSTTTTTTTTTTPGEPTGNAYAGQQSGRCLDVTGQSENNGAKIQLWDCNGQSNQKWTLTGAAELRVYSGKCLDLPSNSAAGTQSQIMDCTGGANQKWSYGSDGSIRHSQTGLCLDANGQGTANGTMVNSWTCNGQTNQKWTRR